MNKLKVMFVCTMIFFAVPKLEFSGEGLQGIYSLVWLGLALLVFGGCFSSLLFEPVLKRKTRRLETEKVLKRRQKSMLR
ncbi:hypothetical protein GJU40_06050 [Bacillus lacus]|uniref:Uncharacterized protein n=1 Tax=Metabacillus lacus TaxID=1983721 RepID=A0A7X2LZA5_9BACI|nr:hypothetical protein [Metabacillus lacus]MRX71737.1 hypothetical protein [Metabacillus lacus]